MAAITSITKYGTKADNQSFAVAGLKAFTQAYEATSIPLLKTGAKEQHVCYAQLTGAMTINAATVLANLEQFAVIFFHFSTDGTQRIVTFGTGFVSSGTLTVPASKDATVMAVYDGTNIKILAREIQA